MSALPATMTCVEIKKPGGPEALVPTTRPLPQPKDGEILIAVGEDPDRDGLRETPARVARAYAELLAGLRVNPRDVLTTTFEADHDELVLVRDIEVTSLCEHHLLPFHGVAHIGYVPGPDGRGRRSRRVDLRGYPAGAQRPRRLDAAARQGLTGDRRRAERA